MVKISYAITVCNEYKEIQTLIQFLLTGRKSGDEIVILYDTAHGTEDVHDYLNSLIWHHDDMKLVFGSFNHHFADWKNRLRLHCSGDYIFQIDADETFNPYIFDNIHQLLEDNPLIEALLVPRVNTVSGLTRTHINKWNWKVNEAGWIQWPDYQWRIWKNLPQIQWVNKVHERLDGFTNYNALPAEEKWALYHPKDINRQEKQNAYYDTL